MDMKLLTVFDEIYKTRSVSRAGENLNLPQTSVSLALGRLRRRFARHHRGHYWRPLGGDRVLDLHGALLGAANDLAWPHDGIDPLGAPPQPATLDGRPVRRDRIGLPGEQLSNARRLFGYIRANWRCIGRRLRRLGIGADHLGLPGDFLRIEAGDALTRARKSGRHRQAGNDAPEVADLVAIARQHEMRHVQRDQRRALGAMQRPSGVGFAGPMPA